MSAIELKIRTALENRLASVSGGVAIVVENVKYTPVVGVPYMQVTLMPAEPDDPTSGGGLVFEQGIFQVTMCYPLNKGVGDAVRQAEILKNGFKRALSLASGGVTVTIQSTPWVGVGQIDEDRYRLPLKIKYFAQNLNP